MLHVRLTKQHVESLQFFTHGLKLLGPAVSIEFRHGMFMLHETVLDRYTECIHMLIYDDTVDGRLRGRFGTREISRFGTREISRFGTRKFGDIYIYIYIYIAI